MLKDSLDEWLVRVVAYGWPKPQQFVSLINRATAGNVSGAGGGGRAAAHPDLFR